MAGDHNLLVPPIYHNQLTIVSCYYNLLNAVLMEWDGQRPVQSPTDSLGTSILIKQSTVMTIIKEYIT